MSFPKSPPWIDGEDWDAAAVNDLEQRTADYITAQPSGTAVSTAAWIPFQDPGVGGRVVKVHISKYDSNRIYVSGDMLGVAVSTDGGGTFGGGFGFKTWEMGSFTEHPTDPLTVWVGSMGGPYRSVDGGQTWALKDTGFDPPTNPGDYRRPIEKVLFDPANSKHLLTFGGSWRIWKYASSGAVVNYGKIFESFDDGESWALKSDLATATGGSANENIMWVAATATWSKMWVATQHRGILISTDQGTTWAASNTGLPVTGSPSVWPMTSVILDPSDVTNQTLFCSLSASAVTVGGNWQPGGVYKTTDGGATWALSGTGQPQTASNVSQGDATWVDAVHLTADGVLYFADQKATHNNDFYKSVDHGATWTHISPTVTPRFFPGPLNVHAFASDPATPGTVWGGTNDGIIYTTDAGATWHDGSNLTTSDGKLRGRGYSGILGTRVTFNRWKKGWTVLNGWDSGNFNLTRDGGQTWSAAIWGVWDFYTGGYDTAFGGPTGNVIYSLLGQAGVFNGVAISQNSGATWVFKTGGTFPGRFANVGSAYQNGVEVISADGSSALVAFAGTMYKTTNFGSTWATVAGLTPSDVASSLDFGTFVSVSPNQVPRASSDGTTWTAEQAFAGAPHVSRVVASSDGSFWAVGYLDRFGGINSGVWHRPAGAPGQTWVQVTGFPSGYARYTEDIAVDPYDPNHIVVATDMNPYTDISNAGGVLESKDGGATWAQRNAGLRMTRVMSVAFDPWEAGKVVAGTDGGGYWTAKMFGAATPEPSGLHSGVISPEDVPGLRAELRKLQDQFDAFKLGGVAVGGSPTGANQTPVTTDVTHAAWQTLPSGSFASWRKDVPSFLGFTINQGGWAISGTAGALIAMGAIIQNLSPAVNDSVQWTFELSAGTWTLFALFAKAANQGIATLFLDGASVGTVDGYNTSTVWNQTASITDITVASTGQHTLKATVAAKNASSSGFQFSPQLFSWVRTA